MRLGEGCSSDVAMWNVENTPSEAMSCPANDQFAFGCEVLRNAGCRRCNRKVLRKECWMPKMFGTKEVRSGELVMPNVNVAEKCGSGSR